MKATDLTEIYILYYVQIFVFADIFRQKKDKNFSEICEQISD
jgi:hypothetical protein